jgi:HK97 family phage major capsid protein
MSALGTTGDLALVDFGYYLLGDRQSMQISSSEHFKFGNDLTSFRIIERLDGRTWIQSAITPENGGSTLSPVVVLN